MTMPSSSNTRTALLFTENLHQTNLVETPLCLLSQMGKSALERSIELCVQAGCKTIWIISALHQQEIQTHLDAGDRWGCQINYLITHPTDHHPISRHMVLHDDVDYLIGSTGRLVNNLTDFDASHQNVVICDETKQNWLGWALISGAWLQRHTIIPDFSALEARLIADTTLQKVAGKPLLSLTSEDDFYRNIFSLLNASSVEQQFGHHLKQHATTQISGAVYIGNHVTISENTQIGPNVIIEDGCYIDNETSLSNCYVSAHTYIGKNLDVTHKLVVETIIYDAKLECVNTIADPWIISSTKHQSKDTKRQNQQPTGWFNQFCKPIFKYFHVNNH